MSDSDSKTAEHFETLLNPLLDSAYGLAYNMTKNAADAEDVLQEAALLAFKNYGSFQQGTNFKAWFYRILTNVFLGKIRKEKRRPSTVDIEEMPELYMFQKSTEAGLGTSPDDPATTVIDRLDAEEITKALRKLPEEYRVVSSLYFVEDMAYKDISEVVGVPVGTVRSRLHRGRKMLQKLLWDVAVERGIVAELQAGDGK